MRVKPIADSPLVSTLWEYFTFPLKGIDHTYMLTWLEHVSYDCAMGIRTVDKLQFKLKLRVELGWDVIFHGGA